MRACKYTLAHSVIHTHTHKHTFAPAHATQNHTHSRHAYSLIDLHNALADMYVCK